MDGLYDAAIIGGGFFGCAVARHLARSSRRVAVLEQRADLLQRASYANQARVHGGYHYPRSPLTAHRSRVNFPRFLRDYSDCVFTDFAKYYAVARASSKVTARFFERFCQRIGAPLRPAPPEVVRLFNPDTVEAVFRVEEVAFDAVKLKGRLRHELEAAGVEVRLNTTVERLAPAPAGRVRLECAGGTLEARQVFNCTYSGLNTLLRGLGAPPVPLKMELTELALVEVPPALRGLGVTVMCGPFFSCMPFPARGLHSLSHVRYTPHRSWQEGPGEPPPPPAPAARSNFTRMARDAARYLPLVGACRQAGSLWEVKAVLPASEGNDSRPILFLKHAGLPNHHCLLGAKLDNVYDVLDEIDRLSSQPPVAA
jgi:glycine/D-amino acid oxidase-like deaminating enzyme